MTYGSFLKKGMYVQIVTSYSLQRIGVIKDFINDDFIKIGPIDNNEIKAIMKGLFKQLTPEELDNDFSINCDIVVNDKEIKEIIILKQ